MYGKKDLIPFIIGSIISAFVLPALWIYKILIPEWGLMLCILPLFIGGILTSTLAQLENKSERDDY